MTDAFGHDPKRRALDALSDSALNVGNWPSYAFNAAQFAGNALSNSAGAMSPVRFQEGEDAGFYPQVPPMITETAGAWGRLFGKQDNWHDGPGEVYPGDQNADAATAALAFYGGNALGGLRRGAAPHAAQVTAPAREYGPRPMRAAMRFGDEIFTGPNHGVALADAEHRLGPSLWDAWDQKIGFPDGTEGFVSADGQFLTRKEAARNLPNYYDPNGELHASSMHDYNRDLLSDNKPSILGSALATADQPQGITAYHGSPHDFDKFSLDKIGTGEGAQAYGHGLYFAENEGVAKSYRDSLAKYTPAIDGKSILQSHADGSLVGQLTEKGFARPEAISAANALGESLRTGQPISAVLDSKIARENELYGASDTSQWANQLRAIAPDGLGVVARGRLRQHGGDIDKTIEYLRSRNLPNDATVLAELESAKASGSSSGRMYQVRINADPEHFLDWDKPLFEQSAPVQDALKKANVWREPSQYKVTPSAKGDKWTVRNVYGDAMGTFKTKEAAEAKALKGTRRFNTGDAQLAYMNLGGNAVYGNLDKGVASAKLREAGIPGIRYLDAMSRRAGAGSSNYVVFDDSIIDILKKYGLTGAVLGAGALGLTGTEASADEDAAPFGAASSFLIPPLEQDDPNKKPGAFGDAEIY